MLCNVSKPYLLILLSIQNISPQATTGATASVTASPTTATATALGTESIATTTAVQV